MYRWRTLFLAITVLMALVVFTAPSAAQGGRNGFRVFNGAQAAAFQLPGDVTLVNRFETAYGLTYERYQQRFGEADAAVLGGQLTLYRDASGQISAVIGAHYPNIVPSNRVNLTAAQARQVAANDLGAAGERLVNLQIDPASGRYFYRVETRRFDSRWIHWINAGNGQVLNQFNALAHTCDGMPQPCGFGVQYTTDSTDVKNLSGLVSTSGALSTSRIETHDQGSSNRPFLGPVAVDADGSWTLLGNISPAQQALVDAHYYANVADAFYLNTKNFNWTNYLPKIVVHAHFMRSYNNAYWNGSYIAVGDGDQISFEELTSLDVIGHELTHGVTEFTSNLIYQNESGALNEAFSDMMGTSMEFYAEGAGLEPAVSLAPDWLIGEDFDLRGSANPGFRNMADPGEDGDPSHYDERYTGTSDNGGVHINSGIANQWYYLLAEGGQNSDPAFASGQAVTGIGLADAEQIAFLGFTALSENATFCDVRAATIAVAGAHSANTTAAWNEVGVDSALCDGGGSNQPPTADFTFTTNELSVTFTDASSDSDGSIASWSWDFGDGSPSSTAQNPAHTYAGAATYQVTLTVIDNEGAAASVTKAVTVTSGGTSGFSLSVSAYKNKGLRYADLSWSGDSAASVNIKRDGSIIATVSTAGDSGSYQDVNGKGGGTFTYQVCNAGTDTCSNPVPVTY